MRLPNICRTKVRARITYLSLISYMAQIDQAMNPGEVELLNQMIQKLGIHEKHYAQILAPKSYSDEEIQELYEQLHEAGLHYSFFMDLLMMAMADGLIQPDEKKLLAHVGHLVSLPGSDFYNLLNFAQVSYQFKPGLSLDPMFDYVIDNLLLWARQKHVRLFQQTTFSAYEEIDLQLKSRL